MTTKQASNLCPFRLRDDKWFDEVRVVGPVNGEAGEACIIKATTVYRYKTSGLSGDEWRTSAAWWLNPRLAGLATPGTTEPSTYRPTEEWLAIDTGYSDLQAATWGAFPAFYGNQPHLARLEVTALDFYRKGEPMYRGYHGEPGTILPLLMQLGHLPWALVHAGEAHVVGDEIYAKLKPLCGQPGCKAASVSVYARKQHFDNRGRVIPRRDWEGTPVIGFCRGHLRRGDCGLNDADENYEVLYGPGPDGAEPDPDVVAKAIFGGFVHLGGES